MTTNQQWFRLIDAVGVTADGEVFVPRVTAEPVDEEDASSEYEGESAEPHADEP